jgi:ABC-type transport system substrate-binding protein
MAVAFLQEFPSTGDRSTTNYDTINEQLAGTPDGLIVHSAGFGEDGTFRIYDVWESREQYERFFNEQLTPLINEVMATGDAAPPARQEVYELHNVRSGGR